ncbi:MAG: phenylalanine--tRNA ligase subunit beta [Clostridia bacterium]|nr:phenylalanine--tRNA ligase subunit beta [Clostridia bacterium]
MKASIEWLNEYADIDVSSKELGNILTMTGSKVETIDSKGKDIKNVVIGKVLSIQKHPDSDHLIVCQVNVGDSQIQIVTGAPNVAIDDIVAVAKDGSELPGGIKIKKGVLRGIESCGMMCSCGELNIPLNRFPNQIEKGLMIIPKEFEKNIGEDIVKVLNLEEEIIDFEITSNRPDCLSIEGLGRETAISLGKKFKNPRKNLDNLNIENKKEIEGLKVDIKAPDLCYRYLARMIKNVKIGPSPDWMVRRLEACGLRSINNIVDITNYVMLELGEPMHAFDIESIAGKHITVRRAFAGEKITTLDAQERILEEDMLVIADDEKVIAIAGVMGGQNSEIEDGTETVVFEAAVFSGGSVRKTAKKVGLRTESSSRFEKGLSVENAERAINRAVELAKLIGVGTPVDGKIDVYPTKQVLNKIKFEPEKINNLLGTNISKDDMIKILEKLEMKPENDIITAPYFRVDIECMADIAEEIARFYGYDKMGSNLIESKTTLGLRTKLQKIEDKIRIALVSRGLSEICTYGFINEKDLDKINLTEDSDLRTQAIKIRNPLSEDFNIMRTTTLPSMLQTLSLNNSKKNKNVKLFDISRVYRNVNNQIEKGENPEEKFIITIGIYGEDIDFYILKGYVETVLKEAGVLRYDIQAERLNYSYHPGKTGKFMVGKDVIAVFGEIHPELLDNYDLPEHSYVAEIDLDKLVKYSRIEKKYVEIPKFPAVERDLAIIVDEKVEVGQIEKIIQRKTKKILEEAKLFDVYRHDKLGLKKKSVAYSLRFRSSDRTLTDEEINNCMDEIIKELENVLGAQLRK